MKQKYFFTGLCLLLILIFISGCAPESETESASLFDKIVLDGANTRSADFEYGMSVEDVLKILNLKEEDLFSLDTYPLDEASSPVSGASEMTMMATEDAFFYSEFGESLPFRLMFTFYDNALRKVVYNVYIDVEDPGEGYELDAIASAVVGGTSLAGGTGSIPGTVIGALIIAVIGNGLDLLGVSSYWQDIVKGAIIVVAVLLDRNKKRQ